jgi:monoamine oxidase
MEPASVIRKLLIFDARAMQFRFGDNGEMKNDVTTLVSRRSILSGLLAATALPAWAQSVPSNPEVVVIGAGSAGLSAARTLIAAGKSVVVVEAAGRIGGRAYTESGTFGVPFDHGCSWVMGPEDLPYVEMARNRGFTLLDHDGAGEAFYVGDRQATGPERRKYDAAWRQTKRAVSRAGRQGLDVPASTVIPGDMEFAGIPQTWMGAMDWAVDFKDLSTMDYWEYGDIGSNYMIKEGYGALVARMGGELPVQLNTPATRVDWSGEGVSVETPAGTIRARACIVTVSTGVLGAGSIKFTPELPERTQKAIHDLPMGLLAKVTLQFDGERFGFAPNAWLTYWVPNEMPAEACFFLTFPFGFNLMIGFVGGDFGWQLSAEGEETAIDFALNEVVRMVGAKARDHFVKGHLTGWAENPRTRGAYAAARPGRYAARAELAVPVADRIFFAGEAVAVPYVQLCGGAYLSGEAVAKAVVSAIR